MTAREKYRKYEWRLCTLCIGLGFGHLWGAHGFGDAALALLGAFVVFLVAALILGVIA